MESNFNPYTWAYVLNQDHIRYGQDPYKRLNMYAEYHEWNTEFVNEIKSELVKLTSN